MRTYEELIEDEDLDLENSAEDQFAYGMCFLEGYGCEKNLEKAVKWLEKSSAGGYEPAGKQLQDLHKKKKTVSKKKAKDYRSMSKLELYQAGMQGDIQAALYFQKRAGKDTKTEQDVFQVYQHLSTMDVQDFQYMGELQYKLGELYRTGSGTQKDEKQAYLCFSNAMELGYWKAYSRLADCYEFGKGVNKDIQTSIQYRMKAAEKGSVEECYEIGILYYEGVRIQKNKMEALTWFHKGMEKKQNTAYLYLCEYYLMREKEETIHTKSEIMHALQTNAQKHTESAYLLANLYSNASAYQKAVPYYLTLLTLVSGNEKKEVKKKLILLYVNYADDQTILRDAKEYEFQEELLKTAACYGHAQCLDALLHTLTEGKDIYVDIQKQLQYVSGLRPQSEEGKSLKQSAIKKLEKERKDRKNAELRKYLEETQRSQEKVEKQREIKLKKWQMIFLLIFAASFILPIIGGVITRFTGTSEDAFSDLTIRTNGFSPNGSLSIADTYSEYTYSADKTENLKNGDKVTITVENKETGKKETKEIVFEVEDTAITTKEEFAKVQDQVADMLYESADDYLSSPVYYDFTDDLESLKLESVYLLTRSDYNKTYTDELYNQVAGIFRANKKDGSTGYVTVRLLNVIMEQQEDAVTLTTEQPHRTSLYQHENTMYTTRSDAEQAIAYDNFQMDEVSCTYEHKSEANSGEPLTLAQGEKNKEAIQSLVNKKFDEYERSYSMESGFEDVSSYSLHAIWFGYSKDTTLLYKDHAVNAAIAIYELEMKDQKKQYVAYVLPNIVDKNGNIEQADRHDSVSSLQKDAQHALNEVSYRFDIKSL